MRLLDFLRAHKRRRLARKGFAKTRKIRRTEPAPPRFLHALGNSAVYPALVVTLVWTVASLTVIYRQNTVSFRYVIGQISDRYVYSEVAFEYPDLNQTRRDREQAMQRQPPIWRIDEAATDTVLQNLAGIGKILAAGLQQPAVPDSMAEPNMSAATETETMPAILQGVSTANLTALEYLVASVEKWELIQKLVRDALRRGIASQKDIEALTDGTPAYDRVYMLIRAEDMTWRKSVCRAAELRTPTQAARQVAKDWIQLSPENAAAVHEALVTVLPMILNPNLVYDFGATQQNREKTAQAVPVVSAVVQAGAVLLRRGAEVTEEDIVRLKRHREELQSQRTLRERTLDRLLYPAICMLLVLAAAYTLSAIQPEIVRQNGQITLIGLILIIQMLLARGTVDLYHTNWSSAFFLFSILPLSFGSMLLAQLIGLRLAIWAGIFTSVIAALQNAQSFQLVLVGGLSCLVAGILIRRARKRLHAFRTGLGVGLTVLVVNIIFVLQNEVPRHVLPQIAGLALLNGIVVATVASTILPFFEYLFGITTEVSLLELSDLNHPLLKRLQIEAPGTYHHSLMVATLAEQAAEAIGANALLARVCAYFHDCGKLSHPEYFAENVHSHNPHEELQPRMSSLVILNHVKEGIDLALKYKLKRPIREAIAQHHGTNLVYYFYRRAIEQKNGSDESTPVGEQDYRYPGPLPKRREIVLISIADSCEAAVRSLEKPTPQKITALVDEIVLKRIRDHQLERADLTFAELAVVQKTIASTLGMMLHGRVRYPREYEDEGDLFKAAEKTATEKSDAPAPDDQASSDA